MATLTVRIDEKLAADLERLARLQHKTRSELAREMLRESLLREKFERARAQLIPLGEKAGYLTDEDVFREIS